MNVWMLILIFVVDGIVIFGIIGGVSNRVWAPLAQQFPMQPISAESFRKNYQTIAIGSVTLGFSVHMAADDEYLHWTPMWLMRQFGCKSASIPWSAIQVAPKQPTIQKSMAHIYLNVYSNRIITIPRWCVDIKNTVDTNDAEANAVELNTVEANNLDSN